MVLPIYGWILLVVLSGVQTDSPQTSSDTCAERDSVVLNVDAARVLGRCKPQGTQTLLHLTVTNTNVKTAGRLQEFTLRFCGDVVAAHAPRGWRSELKRLSSQARGAADIQWSVRRDSDGIGAGKKADGFRVVLGPEWRLGGTYALLFERAGNMGGSSHDCPYPFQ
jgi:hypothetical protein